MGLENLAPKGYILLVRQEAPIITDRHGLSKVGDMIVDFHTHIFPPDVIERRQDYADRDPAFAHIYGNPSARMVDAEGLVEAMGEEGVDKAVVFGFPWADAGICRMANDYLLDAKARYPDRIVPFYTPSLAGGRETVRRAARALEKGMQGIGEVAFYTSGMGKRQWSHLKSPSQKSPGNPAFLSSCMRTSPWGTTTRARRTCGFVISGDSWSRPRG